MSLLVDALIEEQMYEDAIGVEAQVAAASKIVDGPPMDVKMYDGTHADISSSAYSNPLEPESNNPYYAKLVNASTKSVKNPGQLHWIFPGLVLESFIHL